MEEREGPHAARIADLYLVQIARGKGCIEMSEKVQIKGQAMRQYASVYEDEMGEAALSSIVETVADPEFRELLRDRQLLASSWYPVEWLNDFLEKIMATHPGEPDLPERIGYGSADRNIRGIYGFLAKFLSPEICIRQVPRMWKVYSRGIRTHAEILAPYHARLHFSGAGPSRLTWRAMLGGGARRIFESSGAREIEVLFISGATERASRTVVEVRWRT